MKIAIPVNEKNLKEDICISFGRTPYFLIYDTKTKSGIYLDNKANSSQGGAGIKAAQMIIDNNIDILITPRCGENAEEVIEKAKIKIYKSKNNSILDNIDLYEKGELSILNDIHPGFHQSGGK